MCEMTPGCSVAVYSADTQQCLPKGCPNKYAVSCPVSPPRILPHTSPSCLGQRAGEQQIQDRPHCYAMLAILCDMVHALYNTQL